MTDSNPPAATWPWPPAPALQYGPIDLRPFTDADAPDLFTALNDAAVWEHVVNRPSSAQELARELHSAPERGRWPITVLRSGTIVGTTSFLDVDLEQARCEIGHTTFAASVWGTEVNPVCKFLLLHWAFTVAGMNRVQLKTDSRNMRSQTAIARLGATREGVLREYQRRPNGTLRDTVMFSILVNEWPVIEANLLKRMPDASNIVHTE
jgi:N-acetyltransferase